MRHLLSLLLILVSALATVPAHAGDVARARELGDQGLTLFANKHYAEAYEKLAEAEKLYHAPTLVLFMARAKKQLGALLEARTLYAKVIDEPLPEDASTQFRQAKEDAFRELKELEGLIPRVLITVAGEGAADADITIDGEVVASIAQPLDLNPGPHTIRAAAGDRTASKAVTLEQGSGIVRVELTFEAKQPADGPTPTTPAPDAADEGMSGLYGGAIAAFILGAAGLGVGIATGVLASQKTDDIKSRCQPDNHCLTADQEEADSAITLGTVSSVGFIVGGVAIATGIVLVIIPSVGDDAEVAVRVAPNGLTLQGRF